MILNSKIIKYFYLSVLLTTLSFVAYADKEEQHLNIISVEVNSDSETFVIKGVNFELKRDDDDYHDHYKKVTLGNYDVVVETWADTMITAFLPPGIPAGDYRLVVMNKKGESHKDSYDLTLGAVGPKGDKGEKGDPGIQGPIGKTGATGPKGDQGIQGIQGIPGIPGIKGDTGAQGPKGDTGAQGPKGDPGDLVLRGQVCPEGIYIRGFDTNGNILCGPPPVVCSALSRQISITSSFNFPVLQAWPGGTATVTGSTGCRVIIDRPHGTISNLSGDTWAISSLTGYTSCTVSPAGDPTCGAVASISDTLSNGRPYCSNAATSIFDSASTAKANVSCQ